ncbi:MAG TPA: MATE family efflux transporter, partial [Clostridiales bacterium]|nr:MATE family efflux transporter [Clostridiales bacterium]
NIYTSSFFTALNNGKISAVSAVLRSLVFQTSAVLVIPLVFGVQGIWFSNIFAECGCLLANLGFLYHFRKRYHYV